MWRDAGVERWAVGGEFKRRVARRVSIADESASAGTEEDAVNTKQSGADNPTPDTQTAQDTDGDEALDAESRETVCAAFAA